MIREVRINELEGLTNLAIEHGNDAGLISHDAVDRNYAKQQIKQMMINPDYKVFVAIKDDKIVGYIIGNITQKLWNPSLYGEVIVFFVHPEVRNKYLADDLFQAVKDWFIDNGCLYFQASCLTYTKEYQPNDEWLHRVKTYFKTQKMTEVGYHYVKPLEREQ